MGTISLTFRVPVVDKTTAKSKPPFKNFRCRDDEEPRMWRGCPHKHRTVETARRCASSMSMGIDDRAVNERIEIRGFGRRVLIGDGFTAAQRRRAAAGR